MKREVKSITFYDIQWNIAVQCINHVNLGQLFDQQHISLPQHLMQHEPDIAVPIPYPYQKLQCTAANSGAKTNEFLLFLKCI